MITSVEVLLSCSVDRPVSTDSGDMAVDEIVTLVTLLDIESSLAVSIIEEELSMNAILEVVLELDEKGSASDAVLVDIEIPDVTDLEKSMDEEALALKAVLDNTDEPSFAASVLETDDVDKEISALETVLNVVIGCPLEYSVPATVEAANDTISESGNVLDSFDNASVVMELEKIDDEASRADIVVASEDDPPLATSVLEEDASAKDSSMLNVVSEGTINVAVVLKPLSSKLPNDDVSPDDTSVVMRPDELELEDPALKELLDGDKNSPDIIEL